METINPKHILDSLATANTSLQMGRVSGANSVIAAAHADLETLTKDIICLNGAEIQSKHNRVAWAEVLILQLPKEHEDRNSWLINYGHSEEASEYRANWSDVNGGRELFYDDVTDSYLNTKRGG